MARIMRKLATPPKVRPRAGGTASIVLQQLRKSSGSASHRNLVIDDKRTSFRVDDLTWKAIRMIARLEGLPLPILIEHVMAKKAEKVSTTGAMRTFIIAYLLETCSPLLPHDVEIDI